jgi:hypothetical protein
MAWFYRCKPEPDVSQEEDCPVRFWKDTSGRYLDRGTARTLIQEGKTGELDGFTARNGRTYRGVLELRPDEYWKVKVRSLGYNEGAGVSDQPEYEVNPEPLGPCPLGEGCQVFESPTQFLCERALKKAEESQDSAAADESASKSCGFVLPRTVCKREIVREEADVYLKTKNTGLLTEFTSRFGRPFSATLVLKPNGRHGFEFQPRAGGGRKKASGSKKRGKKASTKKATAKKASTKKATAKKASTKKATAKKAAGKATAKKAAPGAAAAKTTRKKAGNSAASSRKTTGKKASSAPSGAAAVEKQSVREKRPKPPSDG